MPRARLLKPGFFANEELAECSPMARLLFAGLWTLADREGRLEDRPKRIKAEIFPYETADCEALLNELDGKGFIVRYANNGQFIQVVSFKKHQHPHMREPASTIPEPDEHQPCTNLAPDEPSACTNLAPDEPSAATAFSGSGPAVTGNRLPVSGDPVTGEVPCPDGTGSGEPRVRHRLIDEDFLTTLQSENPTVNVRDVYERVQNRKTWDGYKDKRKALKAHVGYALAERSNGNGRNGTRTATVDGVDPTQRDPELIRLRALGIIHE